MNCGWGIKKVGEYKNEPQKYYLCPCGSFFIQPSCFHPVFSCKTEPSYRSHFCHLLFHNGSVHHLSF